MVDVRMKKDSQVIRKGPVRRNKVLLFYPPRFEANYYSKSVFEPTTVGYSMAVIGAILKNNGFDVRIYELFDYSPEEIKSIILEENPLIIGISILTEGRKSAFDLARLIKKTNKDIKVVLGGPHATHLGKQIINNYSFVDFCVIGEGDITMLELSKKLSYGRTDFQTVNGIIFRKNGKAVMTKPRQFIENLDTVPFPQYDLYANIDDYKKFSNGKLEFLIITSRGCPFRCKFCATTKFWGSKWRYRSVDSVIAEIDYIYNRYGARNINFTDDAFTINKKRVEQICEHILKKKYKLNWCCTTRADFVDYHLLKLMKRAGCTDISIGVESASDMIQKTINKQLSLKKVEEITTYGRKLGIRICYLLMVGNINENDKSLNETLVFIKKNKPHSVGGAILMIFPDTDFYIFLKEKKLIDDSYWLTDFPAPYCDYDLSYWKLRSEIDKINSFNNKLFFGSIFSFLRNNVERFLKIRITMKTGKMKLFSNVRPVTIRNWKKIRKM